MLAAASGYFAFCKYAQKSPIPQKEKAGNNGKEDKVVKLLYGRIRCYQEEKQL